MIMLILRLSGGKIMKINEEIIFEVLMKKMNIEGKEALEATKDMALIQIKCNYEKNKDKDQFIMDLVDLIFWYTTSEFAEDLLSSEEFEIINQLKEDCNRESRNNKN